MRLDWQRSRASSSFHENWVGTAHNTSFSHVFEKSAITKLIERTGQCPITGVELEKDDLLDLQGIPPSTKLSVERASNPRPLSATSVPGILSILNTEWDSLVVETNTLRQHLEEVRKELSHALY